MVIGVELRANVQVVYLTQADTERIAACTHSNIGVARGTLYTPRGGSVSCYIKLGCGRFAVLTKLLASLQRLRPKFLCGVVLLFALASSLRRVHQISLRKCPLLLLSCQTALAVQYTVCSAAALLPILAAAFPLW